MDFLVFLLTIKLLKGTDNIYKKNRKKAYLKSKGRIFNQPLLYRYNEEVEFNTGNIIITELFISNKIRRFPKLTKKFKNVKKLVLTNTKIGMICKNIIRLKKLETLELKNNNFIEFPKKAFTELKLKELILDIPEYKLFSFPKNIKNNTILRLVLKNVKIDSLKWLNNSLETLILDSNGIGDMSTNMIFNIFKDITQFYELNHLSIINNNLTNFPITKYGKCNIVLNDVHKSTIYNIYKYLSKIKYLDFSCNNFTSIPEFIYSDEQYLNLSNNLIKGSIDISYFMNNEIKINLSNNQLSEIKFSQNIITVSGSVDIRNNPIKIFSIDSDILKYIESTKTRFISYNVLFRLDVDVETFNILYNDFLRICGYCISIHLYENVNDYGKTSYEEIFEKIKIAKFPEVSIENFQITQIPVNLFDQNIDLSLNIKNSNITKLPDDFKYAILANWKLSIYGIDLKLEDCLKFSKKFRFSEFAFNSKNALQHYIFSDEYLCTKIGDNRFTILLIPDRINSEDDILINFGMIMNMDDT
ncbi:Leucine rich repeat protein [Spraguea lophii 42_110]|uniref:Leucine rich repeat protein n=1 Tax=Spraguea lophii (strain 42_110) TaxID=1358809 RepID=S7XLT3_SPRLO|nr:Leucine rich repeat protein [Spraguea lophii 42_110]